MARRRYGKKRHGSRKMTVPISIAAPLAAVAIVNAKEVMQGDYNAIVENFTGYNMAAKGFNASKLYATYVPMVVGVGVHKFIGPAVNKALGRAKIPLLRL